MSNSFSMLAETEINGTIIWIVIVVGIAIVNYVRETFKKTGEDQRGSDDGESTQADKVRQMIEQMKRGGQTSAQTSRRAYSEPPPVHTPPPSLVKVNREKSPPVASSSSDWGNTAVENAASAVLHKMPNAMATAEQSINSLTDAERKALEQLKANKGKSISPAQARRPAPVMGSPVGLAASLRNRNALRAAVLYREILGEPVSMRK